MADCGNTCVVIVIQLIDKFHVVGDIYWQIQKIQNILNKVGMQHAKSILLAPFHCSNPRGLICRSPDCCNWVQMQWQYLMYVHSLVITDLNICTVVTNDRGSVAIKESCGSIIGHLINGQDGTKGAETRQQVC